MKNMKKKLIISIIGIICIGSLFLKGYLDDEKYILNDENSISKDSEIIKSEKEVETKKENISKKKITVYISGEIKNPGIVTLDSDKRLSDAVNILGGVTEDADMNQINLAMKLEDEMHCIIPKKGEQIASNENKDMQLSDSSNSGKININKASLSQLDSIPGIGEATANKILNYIKENGEFKSIEEIKNVNGIGDKKYENMKDYICVN